MKSTRKKRKSEKERYIKRRKRERELAYLRAVTPERREGNIEKHSC